MQRGLLIVLILLIACLTGQSQTPDTSSYLYAYSKKKDFSLLIGYNQGNFGFADVGLAVNMYGTNRHPFSVNYFISNEIKVSDKTVIGPKIGAWVAGGFAMGLNLIYYTDFERASIVFRPEIGIGIEKAKLVYGYNAKFNSSFEGINRHLVGLTYCFTLKRLKSEGLTRPKNAS
jgi:hypothetical protein